LILFLAFHKNSSMLIFSSKLAAKLIIFALLIYLPYTAGQKKDVLAPYSVLETFKTSIYGPYIQTLNWLPVFEAVNYNGLYSLMMRTGLLSSVEDDQKAKQIMHSVARELTGMNRSAKDKYLE